MERVNFRWGTTAVGLREKNFAHQQLVVHGLHDDLLGRVLRDVEAQLQHLAVTLVLDEGAVETVQPGVSVMLRAQGGAVLSALLLSGGTVSRKRRTNGYRACYRSIVSVRYDMRGRINERWGRQVEHTVEHTMMAMASDGEALTRDTLTYDETTYV